LLDKLLLGSLGPCAVVFANLDMSPLATNMKRFAVSSRVVRCTLFP